MAPASNGASQTDHRRGPWAKNPALCCVCGTLRHVAVTFYGKAPAGAAKPSDGRGLNWLKCTTCRTVTLHAEIGEHTTWGPVDHSDGCWGERDNRAQTMARQELPALLADCEDRAISIEWVDDLPHYEVRDRGFGDVDRIIAEVDRCDGPRTTRHHLRLMADVPATKLVGALRNVLKSSATNAFRPDLAYPFCGCGWDEIHVCSYCPGEDWRWRGDR